MINLETAIHDNNKPGILSQYRRFMIDDSLLHPDYFSPDGNGLFHHRQYLLGTSKDIHDINRFGN